MNETFCQDLYQNFSQLKNKSYCNYEFDENLCWPPTEAGLTINQSCPTIKGSNSSQVAIRICGTDGKWKSSNYTKNTSKGYTNYDNCFTPHALDLLKTCREMGTDKCLQILYRARIIEMVGLTLSLVSLIASLYIFYRYRVLRNNRTKIHKNLFIATVLQVMARLVIYIDQSLDFKLIGETDYLCEAFSVLLEYAKTAMFMWMFIEGLYLHNVITVTIFQEYSYIKLYFYIGWGVPLLMIIIWVLVMTFAVAYSGCWSLYYFLPYYWILDGPRYTVIIVNMMFLLNIIRVLVLKLRQSRTSEIEQVRKAVRAAIFLLPLMGIANILFIVDYRLFKKAWKFALWAYVTYFLTSFQGFFIAVLYCFLNEEVRTAVKNNLAVYLFWRNRKNFQRRNSVLDTGVTNGESEQ